ncbi:hypothetical protein [Mesorhizobium japonicum]|uniref:hypothetical protein n=1 Tax=Mesorhizobium japonicum TaxID=2066070 RepID=UPI003B5C801B
MGFTVSLLMDELAFAGDAAVRGEGTLAVLAGSGVALVAAAILVSLLARRERGREHRRDTGGRPPPPPRPARPPRNTRSRCWRRSRSSA